MLGLFFFPIIFQVLNKAFLTEFLTEHHLKGIVFLSSKLKKIFHLRSVFVKLWGFENCSFGQFGMTNAQNIAFL